MQVVKENVNRVSTEASLVGLEGIVLRNGKSFVTIAKPSRVYFRNDGKVTVRAGNASTRLSTFEPVTAWNKSGAVNIRVVVGPSFQPDVFAVIAEKELVVSVS